MALQEGNEGVTYKYTCTDENGVALDISSATGVKLRFRKPDGTAVDINASFYTDGSDGIIMCTLAGITNGVTAGLWKWQAYLTDWGGEAWYGTVRAFNVEPNI